MRDLILPVLGLILEYFLILTAIFLRNDISEWGSSHGADVLIFGVTYLLCILVVALFCNFKPFNMWGVNHHKS